MVRKTKCKNPLPCGCAIVGRPVIPGPDYDTQYWVDQRIVFCPTHRAALDMVRAVKKLLPHIKDVEMEGETPFERAVLGLVAVMDGVDADKKARKASVADDSGDEE